jgi:hypothetical protein
LLGDGSCGRCGALDVDGNYGSGPIDL